MANDERDNNDYGGQFDSGFGPEGSEGLLLPPWERRERYGYLNALYLTVKDVLLAPQRFFHRMPSRVGLLQPLIFAVILGAIGTFFNWMWALAGSLDVVRIAGGGGRGDHLPLWHFGFFALSPIVVPAAVFFYAGAYHLVLRLFDGGRLGFEATFRVVAYSTGAFVFFLVPTCGSPIGLIWSLIVTVIGLYSIHETESWRAIVAVSVMLLLSAIFGAGSLFTFMSR